jgi:hypothetical protein
MTEDQLDVFTNSMWLAVTKTAYAVAHTKGQEKVKYRYVDEIARSLLENLPNSAHLYALERINTVGELQVDMWRQVLTELDKLEAQNGGRVGEHISRREGEPHEAQQELRDADDSNAWRPSTPSGVDESAL